MIPINTGTHFFAASHLSSLVRIVFLIANIKITAITHHISGDTIQESTIDHILLHVTIANPAAVIHAHMRAPITECVAETGALKNVARLIQREAHTSVAIIILKNIFGFSISSDFIIHHLIVSTTSHQAIIAPLASAIIARMIAHARVSAFDHTAGHILLAMSFAPMFMAI
jgi:hypothetical protein